MRIIILLLLLVSLSLAGCGGSSDEAKGLLKAGTQTPLRATATAQRGGPAIPPATQTAAARSGATTPATATPVRAQPAATTKPGSTTPVATRPRGTNCDPSYPTICLPPPPPDLDCSQIVEKNFKVLPPDPHHLDRDGNDLGCEN
jgi:hypothetical protein